MANNVKKEFELYEPMRLWLQKYLEEKYKGWKITTIDSHARTLDLFLEENGVITNYPHSVGLDIQIDVLGILQKGSKTNIVFIEAKKTSLNLHDLGQLWAYCKLCDPLEAFLLSSKDLGSLNKIFNKLIFLYDAKNRHKCSGRYRCSDNTCNVWSHCMHK